VFNAGRCANLADFRKGELRILCAVSCLFGYFPSTSKRVFLFLNVRCLRPLRSKHFQVLLYELPLAFRPQVKQVIHGFVDVPCALFAVNVWYIYALSATTSIPTQELYSVDVVS
jgi:hypothetical protein